MALVAASAPHADALPSVFAHLIEMRAAAGQRITEGLADKYLARFANDTRLVEAIEKAYGVWSGLDADKTYRMPEQAVIDKAFARFQHLYPESTRQPYVPIASKGPWLVSMHGAVVHDSGGYGMLGFGHNPTHVLKAMSEERVMANHMTPSISHEIFTDALRAEIGRSRAECPFESFICLNSGSEANEMVLRLIDMHAGRVAGQRKVHNLVIEGSFHGRTLAASFLTDTTADAYREHKARTATMMQDLNYSLICPPNDIATLTHWFERCANENCFIQCVFLEGVMGEGNPGLALSPEFYMAARELTWKYDAALCIDSIQAGMRTTGNLSIVDYPGFELLPPPDFETYSKALNAGQFPLSVVALNPRGASWYRHGIYGNTMTGNPRACAVATAVLDSMTPELRANIRDMGVYFLEQYSALMDEIPEIIRVNGTGLLFQVKIDERIPVTAMEGIERVLRLRGINVIHGGTNALRFTPNFDITKAEADMQIEHVRAILLEKHHALHAAPQHKL